MQASDRARRKKSRVAYCSELAAEHPSLVHR
jgi:hypothetical protein